ncbi:MAG: hypothetical protein ACOC1F_11505 [Myxococcota bacterium]
MQAPNFDLTVFVATRREDVPATCTHFISVDGSVPGAAMTWDHHVTGEPINLDAMPDEVGLEGFDGVGTTMADTDAVASVVAVMFGGKARLPAPVRQVLASASYRCDHLGPHPALPVDVNERGRGLHGFVVRRLRAREGSFSATCLELARLIAAGEPLPNDTIDLDAQRQAVRALEDAGRIQCAGGVGVVDVRGRSRVDPEAMYERLNRAVAVVVEDHANGGLRYTVGVNPRFEPPVRTLRPALVLLAEAEYAHGAPAVASSPGPGSENWGGRETVFGSPWNYGSRLSVDEVVALVNRSLVRSTAG